MHTVEIDDMRKRPPGRLDVLVNAVYGDESPTLFRAGQYYEKGENVYTKDDKGDITVWKCERSGTYGKAIAPGWSEWSLDDLRNRLSEIELILANEYDIYTTFAYPLSYYIHDVGIRDWEHRGSFMELFNKKKYIPKKNYLISAGEQVVPVEGGTLPDEDDAEIWLNKTNNKMTNLVRRIELEGRTLSKDTCVIPYPMDESLMFSYIYDLFVDGVYISPQFINEYIAGDGTKCIELKFDPINDPSIDFTVMQKLENRTLEFVPPVTTTGASEYIFVYYVSVSHDLNLGKQDINVFIGDEKDKKFISLSGLKITDRYQETYVYNNGIRLRPDQYAISKDRIGVDEPADRFVLGSYATVSVRTFNPVEEDAVTNVKQETIPMYGTEMNLLAIPFLNYDEDTDHFLLFNDGGTLMGSQRWFEDNGYVNLYEDGGNVQPDEMVEFRMVSRDKNMIVTTHILTAREDEQATFLLPVQIRDHYFYMIFTDTGQFVSRTKYAVSGNLLQVRAKYRKNIQMGDRYELILFDYTGEYGFTSLSNYQSHWNYEYTDIEDDNYVHGENVEITPDPDPTPDEPDDDINDLTYDPIVNLEYTKLKYTPPKGEEEPGTRCVFVQDTPLSSLHCKSYSTSIDYILGVDCDHQIVTSTQEGDIVRFDRTGAENTNYHLLQCSPGSGTAITYAETDDFGNTYYFSGGSQQGLFVGKGHIYSYYAMNGKDVVAQHAGNEEGLWEVEVGNAKTGWTAEPSLNSIKSLTYVDGWLYVEYTKGAVTECRIGRVNINTGSMMTINLGLDANIAGNYYLPRGYQIHRAKISKSTGKIYLGTVLVRDGQKNLCRLYEVNINSSAVYPVQCGIDVDFDCGIEDSWSILDIVVGDEYVLMLAYNETQYQVYALKYYVGTDPTEKYNVGVRMSRCEASDAILAAMDVDDNCYIYERYTNQLTKYSAQTFQPVWTYNMDGTSSKMGVTYCYKLFVDETDYHVYFYYWSNNADIGEEERYVELGQNGLPEPLYRHVTVFTGDENVTGYAVPTSVRDLSWRMPSTNRFYIVGQNGGIFTYTQSKRELTKREQDGSPRINRYKYVNENEAENIYIIPDDNYNFYVINKNIIGKYNRYDRLLWEWDGDGIAEDVSEHFVYNPSTKELLFYYYDTMGVQNLAKLTSAGEFSNVSFTLPNGRPAEKADCVLAVDNNGSYYFAYTANTIYRFSRNFEYHQICYGVDTDDIIAGPAGDIVIIGPTSPQALYVSERDRSSDEPHSVIRKFYGGSVGTGGYVDTHLIWKHDFINSSAHARMAVDNQNNIYLCDENEIRKIDEYGNYIWRFDYSEECVRVEPDHILVDDYYRVYFMDSDHSLHRIDQYDLTLNPVPDEDKEPTEPKVENPEEPGDIIEENKIRVQRKFDIPFTYDPTDSSMLIFTNTGQYIGNRFWELKRGQIVLKGAPVYENGWLDIVRIKNEKESVVTK